MAGKLRHLKATMEPTGRTIRVRELVNGDPRQSQLVEVQLGCREDRADFHTGYCRARLHGRFDQCGRRPRKGMVVCGQHGGSYAVRERNGSRLSAVEAGRLSGLARRIRRDEGRVDLTQVPTLAPWLHDRAQQLRDHPERLDLQEDVVQLSAVRDLFLSGQLDVEAEDLARTLAMLTQVKSIALRTRFALETSSMVPAPKVKALVTTLVDLLQRFTPEERLPEVARELRLLAPNAAPPSAADQPDGCTGPE